MSCYQDGDLLTYRAGKRIFTATVIEELPTIGQVLVWNPALATNDTVPVESIVMHQPQLLAS